MHGVPPSTTVRRHVTKGTNTVVGTDPAAIVREATKALAGEGKGGRTPQLWDGKAGERIAEVIRAFAAKRGLV